MTASSGPVEKLFWDDAYRCECDTRVRQVDGPQVRLEATVFFAFAGGQESDHGHIGGFAVERAETDGCDIVYTLPPDHGLALGEQVTVQIDWQRRYRLMRLHFAAEMVLQLVYRLCPGIERIGAHIAVDKARVDFAYADNISRLFLPIETEVAALQEANQRIVTGFDDEARQRRFWEVAGFARMACGGTHPRTTGEVGRIALRRKNTGKGKERIEILLAGA